MRIYRIVLLLTAGLLFIATLSASSFPYGFFTFLRLPVCSVSLYATFRARATIVPFIALLIVAVLFNPVLPIQHPETPWRIIYLATVGAFIRVFINSLNTQRQ